MRLNNNFVLRRIKEEYFLVPFHQNPISAETIFLNQTGGYIFEEAKYCCDRDVLIHNTVLHYGIANDAEAVEAVTQFVDQLIQMGLLVEEKYDAE